MGTRTNQVSAAAGTDASAVLHQQGAPDGITQRLDRIEDILRRLIELKTIKDWYSTSESAELLERAEFTVREWCRQGRVNARKRVCGRGRSKEWVISHEELIRIRNEGLLPLSK